MQSPVPKQIVVQQLVRYPPAAWLAKAGWLAREESDCPTVQ
jgi:hypothetical protein